MGWMMTARFSGGSVADQVQAAVGTYRERLGLLPSSVIVNPQLVEQARAAVEALGLRLPVEGVGGCLVNEVWLRVQKEGKQ